VLVRQTRVQRAAPRHDGEQAALVRMPAAEVLGGLVAD
jgi:hypothetical protein